MQTRKVNVRERYGCVTTNKSFRGKGSCPAGRGPRRARESHGMEVCLALEFKNSSGLEDFLGGGNRINNAFVA
jgi:hypothetical protein